MNSIAEGIRRFVYLHSVCVYVCVCIHIDVFSLLPRIPYTIMNLKYVRDSALYFDTVGTFLVHAIDIKKLPSTAHLRQASTFLAYIFIAHVYALITCVDSTVAAAHPPPLFMAADSLSSCWKLLFQSLFFFFSLEEKKRKVQLLD